MAHKGMLSLLMLSGMLHCIAFNNYTNTSHFYMFMVWRTLAATTYHYCLNPSLSERSYMNGTFRDLLLVDIYCIYATDTIDTAGQVLALALCLYFLSRGIVNVRKESDPLTDLLEMCAYGLITMVHLIICPAF